MGGRLIHEFDLYTSKYGKREAHWSEQTKVQNTEKGMYVGLKQPRWDRERYVTAAQAAAKETTLRAACLDLIKLF